MNAQWIIVLSIKTIFYLKKITLIFKAVNFNTTVFIWRYFLSLITIESARSFHRLEVISRIGWNFEQFIKLPNKMGSFSLDDPVVKGLIFHSAVVTIKMFVMALLTSKARFAKGVSTLFCNLRRELFYHSQKW